MKNGMHMGTGGEPVVEHCQGAVSWPGHWNGDVTYCDVHASWYNVMVVSRGNSVTTTRYECYTACYCSLTAYRAPCRWA